MSGRHPALTTHRRLVADRFFATDCQPPTALSSPAGLRYTKPSPPRTRVIPGPCGSLRASPATAAACGAPSICGAPSMLIPAERMPLARRQISRPARHEPADSGGPVPQATQLFCPAASCNSYVGSAPWPVIGGGEPSDDVIGVDDPSFEDFVAGSSARLFTMARLLSSGNRAEAEDLLQGAYERAYRRWGRISRRADPERYVRQILVNASVQPVAVAPAPPGDSRCWSARRIRVPRTRRPRSRTATCCCAAWRRCRRGSGPCSCCGTSRTFPRPRRR